MKPAFSLLHATYGRPEKAAAAMQMALQRAIRPRLIEYIFAFNNDDPSNAEGTFRMPECELEFNRIDFARGNFIGSAPAWNAAANLCTGEILVQMQDDLELPEGWDFSLASRLADRLENLDQPAVIAVSDGYRTDDLCCTAIMNRARYVQTGEFLHPGYMSVFSDDDFTYRALRDHKEDKCTFISARDLVFRHRHHYHDKSVPMDATYERENSSEAYRIGAALFAERNPLAATDGIRTWG